MGDAVKRVCILGAESTGKTTLARALADAYGTVWNPEYGRVYTESGRLIDDPWTSFEFEHIARVQCWYEDFLAGYACHLLFCDTDAFTTALFHEVYLGSAAHGFEELTARPYDAHLVCGLDVRWAHDGIREFEQQRRWMHARYVAHAEGSGAPWALVEGPLVDRVEQARELVDALLPG